MVDVRLCFLLLVCGFFLGNWQIGCEECVVCVLQREYLLCRVAYAIGSPTCLFIHLANPYLPHIVYMPLWFVNVCVCMSVVGQFVSFLLRFYEGIDFFVVLVNVWVSGCLQVYQYRNYQTSFNTLNTFQYISEQFIYPLLYQLHYEFLYSSLYSFILMHVSAWVTYLLFLA